MSLKKQKDLIINEIKNKVRNIKLICSLSGGLDSSVVEFLLNIAIGKKLKCVFINTGLLRKNEAKEVVKTFKKKLKSSLMYVDASKLFLNKLKNITDPEIKRKIIGKLFIIFF